MIVYQMHEQHGRHIAYTSLEVDDNIKNGWETVTKEKFYAGCNTPEKAGKNPVDLPDAPKVGRPAGKKKGK